MPLFSLPTFIAQSLQQPQAQQQPFWGWPYSTVPAQDNSNGQQQDSLGNIDPNWQLPVLSPWDTATLNGIGVPGLVRLHVSKLHRKDKKQQPGVHNGTLTLQGFDFAELRMKVLMWTEAHWDAYQSLTSGLYQLLYQAIAANDTSGASAAVDIQYPSLAAMNISKVVVYEFSLPEPGSIPGTMEAHYTMIEYNPAKAGSSTNVIGAAPPLSTELSQSSSTPTIVPPDQGPGAGPT